MIMIYLNPCSLLLGLIAWFLPIISLARRKKAKNQNWIIYSMSSVSACAISLFMQILYQNHLSNIEDWSAISDTSGGLVFVSSVLLVTTLILNTILLLKCMKKQ